MKTNYLPLIVAGVMAAASATAGAALPLGSSLNIDFGKLNPSPPNPAPGSTYGGAAGQAGVWNNVIQTGLTSNLVGLDGLETGASINLATDNMNGTGGGQSGELYNLLNDNFVSVFQQGWSLTISGLQNGTYDFYFYASQNMSVPTGALTVNGLSHASISVPANDTSTFTEGVNWAKISGVEVTDGTLTVTAAPVIFSSTGLSGMQLVAPVPEPGTYVLLGIVGAAFLVLRLRRRLA